MYVLGLVSAIIYIGLGLFQFSATFAGLEHWVGLHWMLAAAASLALAYIPLIGTVIGMFGAVEAWGWSWLQAFVLFFGPMIVAFVLGLSATALDTVRARAS